MDGTRAYYTKRNKSVIERQISYDFTHRRLLRYKTDEYKGWEEKNIKTWRGTKTLKKLLNVENKQIGRAHV